MAKLAGVISQKDYLQKYLSGKNVDKKKKKRKISKKATEKRSVIVDDDEIKTMRELADGELDIFSMSEDAPQIAGIIDERPEELRTIETFRSSARWKVISDEHGIEDIQVVAVPSEALSSADSDDDFSPVRNTRDDSDESPPRKKSPPPRHKGRNASDSDASLPRVKCQSLGKQPRNGDNIRDCVHGSRNVSDPKQSLPDDSRWGKRDIKGASPPRKERGEDVDHSSHSRRDRGNFEGQSCRRRGRSPLNSRQKNEARFENNKWKTNQRLESPEQAIRTKGAHSRTEASHRPNERYQTDVIGGDRGDSSLPIRIKKEPVSPLRRDVVNAQLRKSRKGRESTPESLDRIKKNTSGDSGNSNESPPRKYYKKTVNTELVDESRSRKHKHSAGQDSDESPPRKSKTSSRENANESSIKRSKHAREDSDESPPRKSKTSSRENANESSRKSSKHAREDSDESPLRKSKTSSRENANESSRKSSKHAREDSDESPPRKSKTSSKENANESSRKSSKHAREDSDESPPRKSKTSSRENASESSRKRSKHAREDSDESPPRKSTTSSRENANKSSRKRSKHAREDSDESPPRKSTTSSRENANESSRKRSKHAREDSDESPPRKSTTNSRGFGNDDSSKGRKDVRPDNTKSSMQGGSRASRSDGSGRLEGEPGAQSAPIYRDRKTGRKRDLAAEEQQRKEESAKTDVTKEKYTRWGAGLKQVAERESRTRDALHEASKPVARFADDADLDAMLRARDREGDPMLEYIKGKSTDVSVPSKPRYVGSFPPNRYGIAPGHRWDGVDRSTGFERRWFEGAAARQAVAEDAYKWSVADM